MSERTDDARNAPEDRPAGARLSLGRRRLFGLVSWLLPLAVLLGAELAGRWRGYGGYPPIFRHYGSEGGVHWYGTNAPGVNSFFVQHLPHAGGMRGFAFATPKPPGTVRIVFIGESAMLGYPQEPSLTNSAFLASMLQDLWGPSRPVEVLNFGALAMASFPVLQFLDAALDHQPDLVVILCGNNEFYGAYGVASLHRAGASPAAMRLVRAARGLALVQWLEGRMAGAPEEGPARPQRAMEAMAAVRQVGPTDPLRRAAGRTLGTHLGKMVRLCAARRVPVIVCTVPTNERGMFPIGLDLPPPLPAERIREFGRHVDRAEASLVPDPAGAARELQAAIALYDQHARSRFLLARAWT
ncbi:MAG: SGNH/GDSL hydrolase family protein, partial [Candidatus Rokubacteria bacterium]|nr:SGNH/GDSL hydrolase family protein [Candidatus Rokubacteria bacterium]